MHIEKHRIGSVAGPICNSDSQRVRRWLCADMFNNVCCAAYLFNFFTPSLALFFVLLLLDHIFFSVCAGLVQFQQTLDRKGVNTHRLLRFLLYIFERMEWKQRKRCTDNMSPGPEEWQIPFFHLLFLFFFSCFARPYATYAIVS